MQTPPTPRGFGGVARWLPPRDSNPDNVIQSHVSYH
jgi:hypothetical protein